MQPSGYGKMSPDRLDATFAALADPTRRAILARLASGEASVTELAAPFAMTQPAISKHLKVLERAGLISRGQDAQRRPRRLEAKPLAEATVWLEHYRRVLEGNFQRLDSLLSKLQASESNQQKKHGHSKPSVHLATTRSTHRNVSRKRSRTATISTPTPSGDHQ
jgi:DNA-binding transcriptional ArsR family regulator